MSFAGDLCERWTCANRILWGGGGDYERKNYQYMLPGIRARRASICRHRSMDPHPVTKGPFGYKRSYRYNPLPQRWHFQMRSVVIPFQGSVGPSNDQVLFVQATPMSHLFKNKNKRRKSPEPPQPELPIRIADRPPGFRPELGIASKSGQAFPIGILT